MTSFVAGDPGSGTAPEATSFQAAGVQPNNPAAPDQGDVVLEYGGRKFTKDDLIKKLTHADEHIQRLTNERSEDKALMEEVRNALKKQVDVAEVLKQIKGQGANPDPTQQPPANQPAAAPTADEIAAKVLGTLKEGEAAQQREANWRSVTETLTKAYGDATNQKVAQAAAEAGLTLAEAAELAKSKPKAFLKLFPDIAPAKPQHSAVAPGVVNTQSFQQAPRGNSGYAKAGSTKQAVSIYLNRLKELGL